jgi:DNA phosphorothioation-associated putative methyltransferase
MVPISIERHRSAIHRTVLSRPLRMALDAGVLEGARSVFDYGCGRGDDVRFLTAMGFPAVGWDPFYAAAQPKSEADVCYLGFVLNVIESPPERAEVLRSAWGFARQALVVSALVTIDARGSGGGIAFEDGIVTSIGTFQKYFDQQELEHFIRSVTGEEPIALAMGVFAIVRDPAIRAALLVRRIRASPRRMSPPALAELVADRREQLEPLVDFFYEHGRWPQDEERRPFEPAADGFGGLGRAARALEAAHGTAFAQAREAVREDLVLFAALAHLDPAALASLTAAFRRDLVAAFGSVPKAKAAGQAQLMSIGDLTIRRGSAHRSRVGKRMPDALYVHLSAVEQLPRELRLYEAIARRFVGSCEDANLVKLHLERPAVSYLRYPDFDENPHPAIAWSMVVELQTFRVHLNSFQSNPNPPILHRKELFVGPEYPDRAKFERLTRQEEKWDLYDGSTGAIGNRLQWQRRLEVAGLTFRGHRLVRVKG